jgi:hypothetical protein
MPHIPGTVTLLGHTSVVAAAPSRWIAYSPGGTRSAARTGLESLEVATMLHPSGRTSGSEGTIVPASMRSPTRGGASSVVLSIAAKKPKHSWLNQKGQTHTTPHTCDETPKGRRRMPNTVVVPQLPLTGPVCGRAHPPLRVRHTRSASRPCTTVPTHARLHTSCTDAAHGATSSSQLPRPCRHAAREPEAAPSKGHSPRTWAPDARTRPTASTSSGSQDRAC